MLNVAVFFAVLRAVWSLLFVILLIAKHADASTARQRAGDSPRFKHDLFLRRHVEPWTASRSLTSITRKLSRVGHLQDAVADLLVEHDLRILRDADQHLVELDLAGARGP